MRCSAGRIFPRRSHLFLRACWFFLCWRAMFSATTRSTLPLCGVARPKPLTCRPPNESDPAHGCGFLCDVAIRELATCTARPLSSSRRDVCGTKRRPECRDRGDYPFSILVQLPRFLLHGSDLDRALARSAGGHRGEYP